MPNVEKTFNHCQMRKTYTRYQARETLHALPNAERHTLLPTWKEIHVMPKVQKKSSHHETRKGMHPLQSAGNIATIAKRGKTLHRLPSVGNITNIAKRRNIKHIAKRGKHGTGNKQVKSAKSTTPRKRSKESL